MRGCTRRAVTVPLTPAAHLQAFCILLGVGVRGVVQSAAESIRATAGRAAFAALPAVPRVSESASRPSRLRCKWPCVQSRAGAGPSSFHRAMGGDALRARCASALSASRCCFFDGVARSLPRVTAGWGVLLSCVVSLLFSGLRLCCWVPAAPSESLIGAGARMMVPSRRHVTVTPSLRARRAA